MLEVLGQGTLKQENVLCVCSCGYKCEVNVYSILYGLRTSCGCHKRPKLREVLDVRRYGNLTVTGRPEGTNNADVLCTCDCGTQITLPSAKLIKGDNKSCGCGIGFITQTMQCLDKGAFGRWTVLKESSEKGKLICECLCGTRKCIAAGSLIKGDSNSCGCLRDELSKERMGLTATMKVGDKYQSTQGDWFKVIEYESCDLVYIRFDCNGYKTRASAGNIRKGEVRNVFRRAVCGVGYIGDGVFTSKDKAYTHWQHMFSRCYTDHYGHTYNDATVHNDWHNYQVFAEWFHQNWLGNNNVALDKDLLVKGNKIYSKDTCSIVPENLNNFSCTSDTIRGEHPLGTTNRSNKIVAQVYVYGVHETIGIFECGKEAFLAYKKRKEEVARIYADYYFSKGLIQEKLKEALYDYKICIDD